MEVHVVDAATGEIQNLECPQCAALANQIAGLERDIRGWRHRYRELEKDLEGDARQHPLWETAIGVFDYWRTQCNHPRSRFNAERFDAVRPFIEKDGVEACRRAIRGAAYDPFIDRRRNGTQIRYDDFIDHIFKSRKRFEYSCAKAPKVPHPDELYSVATGILLRMPEDDRPTAERIQDAVEQARDTLRNER